MKAHPTTTTVDILAGAALDGFLAARALPPYLPSEPNRMAAFVRASREAPEFLDTLAALYGIRTWNYDRLRRAYFLGAIPAWRPGTIVHERRDGLRVLSPGCPLAAEVERDPRVCQFCQAFHEQVARSALPGQVVEVRFGALAAKGSVVCEMDVKLREEAGA